ncbi:hypothetical protein PN441_03095 [Spirulina major CS-329]|nr:MULTISPECIES: hypothetical protein [Spirulina]MDB9493295.1 hypothetical protein [Spirulina subsalsa CS-330]MDB9502044.1 hypothetical protein [Spirulina major CS-329]
MSAISKPQLGEKCRAVLIRIAPKHEALDVDRVDYFVEGSGEGFGIEEDGAIALFKVGVGEDLINVGLAGFVGGFVFGVEDGDRLVCGAIVCMVLLSFKQMTGQLRLTNYGFERSSLESLVVGNRDSDGGVFQLALHDNVATTLPNFDKALRLKNFTDALTR